MAHYFISEKYWLREYLLKIWLYFGGSETLRHQLKLFCFEVYELGASETFVNLYQSTSHQIPQNGIFTATNAIILCPTNYVWRKREQLPQEYLMKH